MRGEKSGVFYIEKSNVYFSNPDGQLTRRLASSDVFHSRDLDASSFVSFGNVGANGSGFLSAFDS